MYFNLGNKSALLNTEVALARIQNSAKAQRKAQGKSAATAKPHSRLSREGEVIIANRDIFARDEGEACQRIQGMGTLGAQIGVMVGAETRNPRRKPVSLYEQFVDKTV